MRRLRACVVHQPAEAPPERHRQSPGFLPSGKPLALPYTDDPMHADMSFSLMPTIAHDAMTLSPHTAPQEYNIAVISSTAEL